MDKKGRGALLIFFLFVVALAVAGFVFLGAKWEITAPLHKAVFSDKATVPAATTGAPAVERSIVQPPSKEKDWCKIQEINVSANQEQPSRDQIIGWDNLESCCVREVSGFNCALQRTSSVKYCYTANVGGEVKWAMVDAIYISQTSYMSFIEDLDKSQIANKPCDLEKYPILLRPS